MSVRKRLLRTAFRDAVFARAKGQCQARPADTRCDAVAMDAHHIESRDTAPDGGYVESNGIALCSVCHERAERDQHDPRGDYRPGELRRWIR